MLYFPKINPVALSIGPIKVHWYGIMYLIGFISAWLLALKRAQKPWHNWSSDEISDLIFYAALGVILGGRIGYMLFYNFGPFIQHPWIIIRVWDGGMSFHGGLLGVLLALLYLSHRLDKAFFCMTDFIAPMVPIGLAAGRIGNFINGELWGRVTNMPWGLIYPNAGPLPRHPSELYEFFMEGILLFTFLWLYSSKPRPKMAVSAWFLIAYGLFRIIGECFRQPDPQLGFIAFGWLTMGQLLSVPMVLIGVALLLIARRNGDQSETIS